MLDGMGNYTGKMQRTASASASLGSLSCPASGMDRIKVYEIFFGSEGAPADVANLLQIQRTTAAGTSTSVTTGQLDPGDSAAVSLVGENHTIEPTYTSNLVVIDLPLNQKASVIWQAPPYGELVIPATASNGFGFRTPTAGSSVSITATVHWNE